MNQRAELSYDELNIDRQTIRKMIRKSCTMDTPPASRLEIQEPTTPYLNPWDILMPRSQTRKS